MQNIISMNTFLIILLFCDLRKFSSPNHKCISRLQAIFFLHKMERVPNTTPRTNILAQICRPWGMHEFSCSFVQRKLGVFMQEFLGGAIWWMIFVHGVCNLECCPLVSCWAAKKASTSTRIRGNKGMYGAEITTQLSLSWNTLINWRKPRYHWMSIHREKWSWKLPILPPFPRTHSRFYARKNN